MFIGRRAEQRSDSCNIRTVSFIINTRQTKISLDTGKDHRNHGHRLIEERANQGWNGDQSKSNSKHAIDMYTMQAGTARDISFLIDFLPAYLFPNGETKIAEWGVAGISLGGHSTWITLCQGTAFVYWYHMKLMSCQNQGLMSARAEKFGIPLEGSEYLPDSALDVIRRDDPAFAPYQRSDSSNPFWGKKILILSGGSDTLVPRDASEYFIEGLEVGEGTKEVMIQPGAGHEYTKEMEAKLNKFLLEKVLV
uniref:Peptidase S9 prolyl oligopeptidase catalytic domain-containing protein n=1 Tax=Moniliophthora roreri TaxID=221103 RepID=A0A0W0FKC6_MONRR